MSQNYSLIYSRKICPIKEQHNYDEYYTSRSVFLIDPDNIEVLSCQLYYELQK